MTPENPKIPAGARREREQDLAWIAENLDAFWTTATLAFEEAGLRAIVVDTTFQLAPDSGHPYAYFSQDQVEETANEDQVAISSEPVSSSIGEPPDMETLMQWDAEGCCEAACPHHCWLRATARPPRQSQLAAQTGLHLTCWEACALCYNSL